MKEGIPENSQRNKRGSGLRSRRFKLVRVFAMVQKGIWMWCRNSEEVSEMTLMKNLCQKMEFYIPNSSPEKL